LLIDDPLFLVLFSLAVTLLGLSKGGLAGVGILSVPMLALAIPPVDAAGVLLPDSPVAADDQGGPVSDDMPETDTATAPDGEDVGDYPGDDGP
jgi:hypothetical protein